MCSGYCTHYPICCPSCCLTSHVNASWKNFWTWISWASFRASQASWSDKPSVPSHHRPFSRASLRDQRAYEACLSLCRPCQTYDNCWCCESDRAHSPPYTTYSTWRCVPSWGLILLNASLPFRAGYTEPFLGGGASLGHASIGFLIVFLNRTFSIVSRLWSINLVDSRMVLWSNSLRFLQSIWQVANRILANVVLLNGTFPLLGGSDRQSAVLHRWQ